MLTTRSVRDVGHDFLLGLMVCSFSLVQQGAFPQADNLAAMRSAISRHVAVVSQLDRERPRNLTSDLHECGHRLLTSPVALQLANELHQTDHLAAGLFDAAQGGL